MGYIKHHAIIVTGGEEELDTAWNKAIKIFDKCFSEDSDGFLGSDLVGYISDGNMNGYRSFLISPDGSKEGWEISQYGDNAREKFVNWLRKKDRGVDFIEVSYGGDDNRAEIVN